MCGAYLCNKHFQEGHTCKKAEVPVMALDLEAKVETGYETKVQEPKKRGRPRG
jgi:hypothetical protein